MTTISTIVSSRVADVWLLGEVSSNVDGDQTLSYELPTTFGDCLLLEWWVQATQIATMMTNPELNCVVADIIQTGSGQTDHIGAAEWRLMSTAALATLPSQPDSPVLWRQGESVRLQFKEVDTNASFTADIRVFFKVRRLRTTTTPLEPQPILP